MQREDIVGIIFLIGSTVAAIYGYLANIVIFQTTFTFLAGSSSTYLVQRRLQAESEKRRTLREQRVLLRDRIYGPLFQTLNRVVDQVTDVKEVKMLFGTSPLEEMKRVMTDYLYLFAPSWMKDRVNKIYEGLEEYSELLKRAERAVFDVSSLKLNEYPEMKDKDPRQIYFYLREHGVTIKIISFVESILKKINPLEEFHKSGVDLENPTIEVIMGSTRFDNLQKFDEVHGIIERNCWKEKRLLELDAKRKELYVDLTWLIPQLMGMIEETS